MDTVSSVLAKVFTSSPNHSFAKQSHSNLHGRPCKQILYYLSPEVAWGRKLQLKSLIWKGPDFLNSTRAALPLCLCLLLFGCSDIVRSSQQVASGIVILKQPGSLSVPTESSAVFTVVAKSPNSQLSYQWTKNDVAIPGAQGASYIINSVAQSDDGALFTVTVSDGHETAYSQPAKLLIGPRSPLIGDLRFKQVGAETTINGYSGLEASSVDLGLTQSFSNAIGTPLSIGPGCNAQSLLPTSCSWNFNVSRLPAGQSGISSGYYGALITYKLSLSELSSSSTVITGIDVEAEHNVVGVSWMRDDTATGLESHLGTVPLSQLAQVLSAEAASGRVATAVSSDGVVAQWISYGWKLDQSIYETSVIVCSADELTLQAAALAKTGYIITAMGINRPDSLILVGTRVAGDHIARPVLVVPLGGNKNSFAQLGYAIVGLYIKLNARGDLENEVWVGER